MKFDDISILEYWKNFFTRKSCVKLSDTHKTYSPLGSLLAWYVGDKHANRIGKWLNLYCRLFKIKPSRFHRMYPT
jgi:hypothetical protein